MNSSDKIDDNNEPNLIPDMLDYKNWEIYQITDCFFNTRSKLSKIKPRKSYKFVFHTLLFLSFAFLGLPLMYYFVFVFN